MKRSLEAFAIRNHFRHEQYSRRTLERKAERQVKDWFGRLLLRFLRGLEAFLRARIHRSDEATTRRLAREKSWITLLALVGTALLALAAQRRDDQLAFHFLLFALACFALIYWEQRRRGK